MHDNTIRPYLTQPQLRALERAREMPTAKLARIHRRGLVILLDEDRLLLAAVLFELCARRRNRRPLALSTMRKWARRNVFNRAELLARLGAAPSVSAPASQARVALAAL